MKNNKYERLLAEFKNAETDMKLMAVKAFYSSFEYKSDDERNVWQTQRETHERGCGDCEDLAIAAFFALLDLGVDENDLLIVYGYVGTGVMAEKHMIVTCRNDSLVSIDNQYDTSIIADKYYAFTPEFGFNRVRRVVFDGGWDNRSDAGFNLSKWDRVLKEQAESKSQNHKITTLNRK